MGMNFDFSGRTIIVTGGAHGLGRAMVQAFVERGGRVWTCDVLADALAETRELCGAGCEARVVDVRDREAVGAFVEEASRESGRVDILDSLSRSGFRRIVFVNGHGGNAPAGSLALEWMADNPGHQVKMFDWWIAPKTLAKIKKVDPVGSHASWIENFPWTRLAGVALPQESKPLIDKALKSVLDPVAFKDAVGDGNYGGVYQRPDEEMMAIWEVAVAEARATIEEGWA
jgi:hypothetical protein